MVRGPVRKQSMDPVRSGGPRTGGQSLRVTLIYEVTCLFLFLFLVFVVIFFVCLSVTPRSFHFLSK